MPLFRKKPVVIEAVQLPDAVTDWPPSWPRIGEPPFTLDSRGFTIATLEGDHLALPGDWIIRGVKGEFYPCKPDIFAMTYEPAAPSQETETRPMCADCADYEVPNRCTSPRSTRVSTVVSGWCRAFRLPAPVAPRDPGGERDCSTCRYGDAEPDTEPCRACLDASAMFRGQFTEWTAPAPSAAPDTGIAVCSPCIYGDHGGCIGPACSCSGTHGGASPGAGGADEGRAT
jgi:hypothetical protein